MTATLGTVLGIFTALATAVGLLLAARANARDAVALRQAAVDKAVTDAKAPLIADNARLSSELAVAKTRITQLEDWIYGGKKGDGK